MELKVVFKGVTKYDFMDDSNKRVFGTNVWVEETNPVQNDDAYGIIPKKISFNGNLDIFQKMRMLKVGQAVVPVVTESFGSRGIISKITDFKPVQ